MNGVNNYKQTMSYLDLSAMEHYRKKFESLASTIRYAVYNNYEEFLDVIDETRHYGDDVKGNSYNYARYGTIDGYDFLTNLLASPSFQQYSSKILSTMRAYQRVVAYCSNGVDSQDSHGLAIHVCVPGSEQFYPAAETHFNNWRSLFITD